VLLTTSFRREHARQGEVTEGEYVHVLRAQLKVLDAETDPLRYSTFFLFLVKTRKGVVLKILGQVKAEGDEGLLRCESCCAFFPSLVTVEMALWMALSNMSAGVSVLSKQASAPFFIARSAR